MTKRLSTLLVCLAGSGLLSPAHAQPIESVGPRASGMGGAFVAVADDSSATWWNPAGLAAGPFLDAAIARSIVVADGRLPAARDRIWALTVGTPPFGLSYYRLRLTDIRVSDPTAQERADREDRRAEASSRSLSVSQLGATVLHTVLDGLHVGTTVKYVRGTALASTLEEGDAARSAVSDLLDRADDLENGDGQNGFDLDVGVLGVIGAFRLGIVGRNLRAQEFDAAVASGSVVTSGAEVMRLPRQFRAGVAYDGNAIGRPPFIVALDADLRAYVTGSGERRVVAAGGERWWAARRIGVRAGGRFNTAGEQDRAVTAGATVSPRAGMYVDGHVVYGGESGEAGWGVAARVSF
jgi:hypothetical protein